MTKLFLNMTGFGDDYDESNWMAYMTVSTVSRLGILVLDNEIQITKLCFSSSLERNYTKKTY